MDECREEARPQGRAVEGDEGVAERAREDGVQCAPDGAGDGGKRQEEASGGHGLGIPGIAVGSAIVALLCFAVVAFAACTGVNSVVRAIFPGEAPVADAGPDRVVVVGDRVAVDSRGSTEGVGLWAMTSRPDGSAARLTLEKGSASFVADVPGTYGLMLVVSREGRLSQARSVAVSAIAVPQTPQPQAEAQE